MNACGDEDTASGILKTDNGWTCVVSFNLRSFTPDKELAVHPE
jgi:hypothetical protein